MQSLHCPNEVEPHGVHLSLSFLLFIVERDVCFETRVGEYSVPSRFHRE
jgi:hypothetical protein